MWQKVKNVLKSVMPPPVNSFMREVNNLHWKIGLSKNELRDQINSLSKQNTQLTELIEKLIKEDVKRQEKLVSQNEKLDMLFDQLNKLNEQFAAFLVNQQEIIEPQKKITETLKIYFNDTADRINEIKKSVQFSQRTINEILWAEIFNNTITNSSWLKNREFSPGRWAAGYAYLYVMYRVLNEFRPKRILEMGLGQTTRMIAQYASANPNVVHYIVEHDKDWIEFFKNDFSLPENSTIVQLDRQMIPFKEAEAVRTFIGFEDKFKDQQFDFISIDAPLGSDMKEYARIDILGLLPKCLAPSFVIMMDDYDRPGEQSTGGELECILKENQVEFKKGIYRSQKDLILWCSPDNVFLTSM